MSYFSLPFLYIQDAVSLTFLLISLILLRRTAIAHLRLELMRIREDLLALNLNLSLPYSHPQSVSLRNAIDSAIKVAPLLSVGRLGPAYRFLQSRSRRGLEKPPGASPVSYQTSAVNIVEKKTSQKMSRLWLELNFTLGIFLAFGSISGWFLLPALSYRLLRRTFFRRSRGRIDYLFDLAERCFSMIGRRFHFLTLRTLPTTWEHGIE